MTKGLLADCVPQVVLYHVVVGDRPSAELRDEQLLDTTSPRGRQLRVNFYEHGADMEVGGAGGKVAIW